MKRQLSVLLLVAISAVKPEARAATEEARASSTNDATSLLARFAKSPGFEARFSEEKFLTILKAPLRSEGSLHFARPGQLAKRTEKPQKSVVLVADGELKIADGKGEKTVSLEKNPALRPLVESFLLLLSGDKTKLEENFRLGFEGGETYKLTLEPKKAPLTSMLTRIEIEGSGTSIATMTVVEASGDRTHTRFSAVNAERSYSAEEKQRIFSPKL